MANDLSHIAGYLFVVGLIVGVIAGIAVGFMGIGGVGQPGYRSCS